MSIPPNSLPPDPHPLNHGSRGDSPACDSPTGALRFVYPLPAKALPTWEAHSTDGGARLSETEEKETQAENVKKE